MPSAQGATLSVNCGTGGNLQAKINAATSGSTILVKGTCFGSFQVVNQSLTIKGNPTATLDGNDIGRTLLIANPSANVVHLVGLTVTGGSFTFGAGIYKGGGNLTLNKVNVTANQAVDTSGTVGGGGIYSLSGSVSLTSSTVTGNQALATGGATSAKGGGIFSLNGSVAVTQSMISTNRAAAIAGAANAYGGGIFVTDGNLTVKDSVVSGDRAVANPSSGNASSQGGGFYLGNGILTVQGSSISGNRATASSPSAASAYGAAGYHLSGTKASVNGTLVTGNAGTAQSGGAASAWGGLYLVPTSESFVGSRVVANTASANALAGSAQVVGPGVYGNVVHATSTKLIGNIGKAAGSSSSLAQAGGLYATQATLSRSTVSGNVLSSTTTAGPSSTLGAGLFMSSHLTLGTSTVSRNSAMAKTSAASGASAMGGGVSASSTAATNSTIALNKATATSPNAGGTSTARGGGIQTGAASSPFVNSTVAHNITAGTGAMVDRIGGGISGSPNVDLTATIVADNTAATGPDCFGAPTSHGHNLVRNKTGCSFMNESSDIVGKDPRLGTLAYNGGPTLTLAIALSSPALNAIPAAACAVATDQRGVHRPQGTRCDIGAYERKLA
jgi:hypothetical protein